MSAEGKTISLVRWGSIAAIVISVVVLLRILPLESALALVSDRVADLGWLGPIAFGLVYVAAALFFVPGSILTLAAGAVFGLAVGTATVAVSATTAAALAFLLARYALRSRVEALASERPRFAAIDSAIQQGGWRIVGLLRLSPAVPFSIANYLFGLTKVSFHRYVVTSFVAMLPGTFMYVYLGYAGRASASGGGRTTGEWALLAVGLMATIAVTIYVTRLAQKALRERTAIDEKPAEVAAKTAVAAPVNQRNTIVLAAAAVVSMAAVAVGYSKRDAIAGAFGPPKVELQEKFANSTGSGIFDHSGFDAVLADHVDAGGWVDYAAISDRRELLDDYLASLASAELDSLSRDERLAFYINAYNAATLALILEHQPLASIKDIPADKRWDAVRWTISGAQYSLNQIEHQLIRGQFEEPRIHFAVNCASVGCPPLRNEAYTGAKLEGQLAAQTEAVHRDDRWFDFDPTTGELKLTRLYQWYGDDFVQVAGSVLNFAEQYSPELSRARAANRDISRQWLEYSWKLNSSENRVGKPADGALISDAPPDVPKSQPRELEAGKAVAAPPAVPPAPSATTADSSAAKTRPAAGKARPSAAKARPSAAKETSPAAKPKPAAGKQKPPAAKPKPVTKGKPVEKPTPAAKPKPEPKADPKPEGGGGSSGGGGGSSGAPIPRGFR